MTINIDLTNPINIVRAMVGDIDPCEPLMSDMMYQQILDMNDINDRSECVIVWFSAIKAAEILVAQYATTGQRARERVNAVEVENYGAERYRSYLDLLKYLKRNPPSNCNIGLTLFYFGGTYSQCDNIYTLQYIKDCLCGFWGCQPAWIKGYTLSLEEGVGEIFLR